MILDVKNVRKTFQSSQRSLTVLEAISFDVSEGEILALVGPSGSGKTTLLGLCAGLDRVTEGEITLCGKSLNQLSEDQRAKLRNEQVGFVFQNFQLLPTLTARENVAVPLELQGDKNAMQFSTELLQEVGLGDRLEHYPSQLSGGEQQRVAIARAFANKPSILFADEPTGNLDFNTGKSIVDLLFNLNKQTNTTLILVTHDLELASKADRMISLKGGRIEKNNAILSDAGKN